MSYFLKKHIKALNWPGNTSDFNLIEILRAILKNKVANKHPTSVEDLEMVIKCIWKQNITAAFCKHLVHSTPCLLHVVIKKKCEHTNYYILNSLKLKTFFYIFCRK